MYLKGVCLCQLLLQLLCFSCTSSSLQSLPRPKRSNHFVNFHSDQRQSVTIVTSGGKTSLMHHTATNSSSRKQCKSTVCSRSQATVTVSLGIDNTVSLQMQAAQETFQYNYCNRQTTELRSSTQFDQAPPSTKLCEKI